MFTHEEIEYAINNFYRKSENGTVTYKNDIGGFATINSTVGKWYNVLAGRLSNFKRDLHFSVEKNMPVIMMYFQLKGTSTFVSSTKLAVAVQTHSLNYLPEFKLSTTLEKNTEEEYFCIKIFPELLLQHLNEKEQNSPLIKFCERKDFFVTLDNAQVITPAIYQSIHDYLHCPYKGALATAYKENIVMNLFIHQLAVYADNEATNEASDSRLNQRDIDLLNDIRKYIDEHYLEVASLQQLTRKFCINSFKLKHGFKQLFGNSVMKQVDEHKMNYARTLLQRGNIAVNDVADELGYNHYNNFSTAFKRKFGYSPATLRR
jgi:AraC-like DNA-binding protein